MEELLARIAERRATIGVIGLGYVGLPLALEFAGTFSRVLGFDVDTSRVVALNNGKSHIADVSDVRLARAVRDGLFVATTDFSRLADCDAIVICVPTPLNAEREPDLSYIKNVAQRVGAQLRPGQLVVLESTSPTGTTQELILPLLEAHGLELDQDFLLAFSPERVDPGTDHELSRIPKVVGGCSALSTRAACELYGAIVVSVCPVSSASAAETVKLFENTFRQVNIALVNEFAELCRYLDLDTNEIIDAAATKPFGFMPFHPGPGVGGECIPITPLLLRWKAQQRGFLSRFITLADEINSTMPAYVVGLVEEALKERAKELRGACVLLVGVAYKPGLPDMREAPSLDVIDHLQRAGAIVWYYDPFVPELRTHSGEVLQVTPLSVDVVRNADCILILTKHSMVDYAMLAREAQVVVDTRDALEPRMRSTAHAEVIEL